MCMGACVNEASRMATYGRRMLQRHLSAALNQWTSLFGEKQRLASFAMKIINRRANAVWRCWASMAEQGARNRYLMLTALQRLRGEQVGRALSSWAEAAEEQALLTHLLTYLPTYLLTYVLPTYLRTTYLLTYYLLTYVLPT